MAQALRHLGERRARGPDLGERPPHLLTGEPGHPDILALYPAQVQLFARLVDDAAMFPPGNAPVVRAVAEHLGYRRDWFAPMIGPLVVPDARLADLGAALRQAQGAALRQAQDAAPGQAQDALEISVVNRSGAGGLLALGRRPVAGLQIVAVESALRDLDDLAGNARRLAAAAAELPEGVAVFVEVPYVPGWERAVELIEVAGLSAKIRTGGTAPGDHPSREQLAEQLSVLVEADLSFKATAGLHHAWPVTARNARDEELPQHGFLTVMIALAALIDGADRATAADRLGWTDRNRIAGEVAGWDEATGNRVRRRFRSFGCCGVRDPVGDLVALGLVHAASRAPR